MKTFVVAIDGMPGAGKTSLVGLLKARFEDAVVIDEPRYFGQQHLGVDTTKVYSQHGQRAGRRTVFAVEAARLDAVRTAKKNGAPLVIVDRTCLGVISSAWLRTRHSRQTAPPASFDPAPAAPNPENPSAALRRTFLPRIIWPDHAVVITRDTDLRRDGILQRGRDIDRMLADMTCNPAYEHAITRVFRRMSRILPVDFFSNNGSLETAGEELGCLVSQAMGEQRTRLPLMLARSMTRSPI